MTMWARDDQCLQPCKNKVYSNCRRTSNDFNGLSCRADENPIRKESSTQQELANVVGLGQRMEENDFDKIVKCILKENLNDSIHQHFFSYMRTEDSG
ncbi:hypothetical protein SADUNF_Sadunf07G0014100 [Salix dunnii]|uniref:Uncharacterized protein n=1 Tax=Salix dunnii TaxID=1413687 RepID=A0A835JYA5_9ROSI|nr:hypothetical protein SADUNF_Sadunf07G0014100 [Salix dunnii]